LRLRVRHSTSNSEPPSTWIASTVKGAEAAGHGCRPLAYRAVGGELADRHAWDETETDVDGVGLDDLASFWRHRLWQPRGVEPQP
jgi:hypothetical protein